MAITQRQSELFAGATWQVLYQAFTQINFNASDPTSINAALRQYIQTNYPEDFNDWIESSEFVAILDLLAWLAGNLAFKTDLAVRENFLEAAEAKASILRLARFLSYAPARNQPATGLLKLTGISTDAPVTDSVGNNLANTTIVWNDPNNANWYDQFIAVLNDALIGTNPFGIPLNSGTVGGIATQLYRLNGLFAASRMRVSTSVSGIGIACELCNATFQDGGTISERPPNPQAAFHLCYLNDGAGNSSATTGFVTLFRQGQTATNLFNITVPQQNQLLYINTPNINQTDVWVQTVDDSGTVLIDWIKVPSVFSANITFNSLPPDQRNIFSVITQDNDQVAIRFSDGLFGNAPVGNILVTYRVSNGLIYSLRPTDLNSLSVPFTYFTADGTRQTLTMRLSLQTTVSNSAPAETVAQIQQRAPQVYATQNRMVSGEDYNSFPLSANLAIKIKAVNRVYSGQSRYIDLNDPTGTYRPLSLVGDDLALFREPAQAYAEIPLSLGRTAQQIVEQFLQPALNRPETTHAFRDLVMQQVLIAEAAATNNGIASALAPLNVAWLAASSSLYDTTGTFSSGNALLQPGAIVHVQPPGGLPPLWVPIIAVDGSANGVLVPNTAGPVTLGQTVPNNSQVLGILPSFTTIVPSAVLAQIAAAPGGNPGALDLRNSFALWYDYAGGGWSQTSAHVSNVGPAQLTVPTNSTQPTMLLVAVMVYGGGLWRLSVQGTRYVCESPGEIEWYDNGRRAIDPLTGTAGQDLVRVLSVNHDLNNQQGYALRRDYTLALGDLYSYPDGTPEPKRILVDAADVNGDGYPDDPDLFYRICAFDAANPADLARDQTMLFWTTTVSPGPPVLTPTNAVWLFDSDTVRTTTTPPLGTVGYQLSATATSSSDPNVQALLANTFWNYTSSGWQQDFSQNYVAAFGRGNNVAASYVTASQTSHPGGAPLLFNWKHYPDSDHRLDPCNTNINDVFVLTTSYDTAVRQWITTGADPASQPLPPTEYDLRTVFQPLEAFRMFSDAIIWRPVKYKFLFGTGAEPELQMQFKVVRIANAAVSNGEIQTAVIAAINRYFATGNWDFGDTFYFTELAAYVHQQLAGLIGSIVPVPTNPASYFGDGFEVASDPDELFISTAQVADVVLIPANTATALRVR